MLWKMIKKQRLRWGQFLPSIPFSANQDTHRTSQAAIEDIENASSTVKGWRGRCLASQGTYSVHSKSCDIWTRVFKHRYFQSPAYFPFMTSMTALSQVCNESKRQLKKQRKKRPRLRRKLLQKSWNKMRMNGMKSGMKSGLRMRNGMKVHEWFMTRLPLLSNFQKIIKKANHKIYVTSKTTWQVNQATIDPPWFSHSLFLISLWVFVSHQLWLQFRGVMVHGASKRVHAYCWTAPVWTWEGWTSFNLLRGQPSITGRKTNCMVSAAVLLHRQKLQKDYLVSEQVTWGETFWKGHNFLTSSNCWVIVGGGGIQIPFSPQG